VNIEAWDGTDTVDIRGRVHPVAVTRQVIRPHGIKDDEENVRGRRPLVLPFPAEPQKCGVHVRGEESDEQQGKYGKRPARGPTRSRRAGRPRLFERGASNQEGDQNECARTHGERREPIRFRPVQVDPERDHAEGQRSGGQWKDRNRPPTAPQAAQGQPHQRKEDKANRAEQRKREELIEQKAEAERAGAVEDVLPEPREVSLQLEEREIEETKDDANEDGGDQADRRDLSGAASRRHVTPPASS
jgi:hypothetical protein